MVAALVPIYFGRVGSFVIENRNVTTADAEERVERQARQFELLKPYLVDRWTALDEAEAARGPGADARGQGAGAMSGEPLPSRILIPVANPLTAEELIRIGAALMDERTGELTALGIVEVPEGMPLSEGATRARQARRLLQKVLDYVARGDRHPPAGAHRAPRRRRDRGGRRRAGSGPDDLRLGRQVRRRTGSPARPSSAPRSTRSSASRRATSPSSSSAAPATSAGSWSPSAAARTPSWRCASRTPWPTATTPRSWSCTSCRPASPRRSARRPSAPSPSFARQFVTARSEPLLRETANVRAAILREAERADLVVMGASAPPGEAGGVAVRRRSRRPSPSARSPPSSWSRRASRSAARRSSSWPRRPRRWSPPTAPPRSRAPSRPGWTAGSPRPTSTTASSATSAG